MVETEGIHNDDLVSGGACNGMRNSLTDSPMQWTHWETQ